MDLPAPLSPTSADHLAGAHLEVDAVERLHAPKRLRDPAQREQRASPPLASRHCTVAVDVDECLALAHGSLQYALVQICATVQ